MLLLPTMVLLLLLLPRMVEMRGSWVVVHCKTADLCMQAIAMHHLRSAAHMKTVEDARTDSHHRCFEHHRSEQRPAGQLLHQAAQHMELPATAILQKTLKKEARDDDQQQGQSS
jgi:hypothetical protein